MSQPTVFTTRLEIERYKRGISRQALADAVGTTLKQMDHLTMTDTRHLDRGEFILRIQVLKRVARVFGMLESEAYRLLDQVHGRVKL